MEFKCFLLVVDKLKWVKVRKNYFFIFKEIEFKLFYFG